MFPSKRLNCFYIVQVSPEQICFLLPSCVPTSLSPASLCVSLAKVVSLGVCIQDSFGFLIFSATCSCISNQCFVSIICYFVLACHGTRDWFYSCCLFVLHSGFYYYTAVHTCRHGPGVGKHGCHTRSLPRGCQTCSPQLLTRPCSSQLPLVLCGDSYYPARFKRYFIVTLIFVFQI